MTKQIFLYWPCFARCRHRQVYNPYRWILYNIHRTIMSRRNCNRYSPSILTEWYFRHPLTGNWFVSIAGGTSAFLGTPLGCEDLFGRLKPSYSFAVGKWFTPSVGARINYSGVQFKDGTLSNQDYHHIHADLLWNVLGCRYARQEQVRWNLAPLCRCRPVAQCL